MRSVSIWGFHFTPLSIPEIVAHMTHCWDEQLKSTVVYQNLHTLHLQTTNTELPSCYEDTVAIIDGLPIIAALRISGEPVGRSHRVTGIDLLDPVLEQAGACDKSVFVIGQPEDVLAKALDKLRANHPAVKIDGHHGFFDTDGPDSDHVIDLANDFGADLVIVGIGTPKSETWLSRCRGDFAAPVVWSAGALMEYVAEAVPTPPRWSGPLGLEWAFRMASDPRRFLYRYLVEPPLLAWRLATRRRHG